MNIEHWKARVDARELVVGVIGLGYVGLPVACEFARAGFSVVGVDVQPARVAKIAAGDCPIEGDEPGLAELLRDVVAAGRLRATTNYADLAGADVISINVDTPIESDHLPRFDALRRACSSLGAVLKSGALVIVESTVAPGTTERIVAPALEQSSGLRVHEGFFLGACPERVMPGRLLSNLRSLSRVCGGGTASTAEAMASFYRAIIPSADLDRTDIVTAELVKTVENAYRDVNIAFANEVALVCESSGGDVWKVRDLVNKSPGRAMLLPGAGVGGHCIPKDPWLLVAGVRGENTAAPRLIPAARAVNESMPVHTAQTALRIAGRERPRVLLLGYAYLENSDDTRHAPSEKTAAVLRESGADVSIHDPFVRAYADRDVYAAAEGCDVVVLMVKHDAYRELDWARLRASMRVDAPAIVDARGFIDQCAVERHGWRWARLGAGAAL